MSLRPVDQSAFAAAKIATTLEAMSSLMAVIHRLDRKGFDTTDAKDRLVRLEKELAAWQSMQRSLEAM